MPFDSNGNYSLAASYFVENGDTVLPIQHNPPLEDIQQALSSVLLRSGVAPMTGDLPMGTKKIVNMADGTNAADAVTKQQLDLKANAADLASVVPAGTVIYFANTAAPAGYIKANGALLSRTVYAKLFAAIGTLYGAGDGATTFRVPDFRGEFIRGWDDGRGADPGRGLGTFQDQMFISHSHGASMDYAGSHQHAVYQSAGNFYGANGAGFRPQESATGGYSYTSVAGDHVHGISIYAAGGGETRPRNIALLACIKY